MAAAELALTRIPLRDRTSGLYHTKLREFCGRTNNRKLSMSGTQAGRPAVVSGYASGSALYDTVEFVAVSAALLFKIEIDLQSEEKAFAYAEIAG